MHIPNAWLDENQNHLIYVSLSSLNLEKLYIGQLKDWKNEGELVISNKNGNSDLELATFIFFLLHSG